MKLIHWLTKPETEDFSDYSTYLMKVEKLERLIHDACLENDYKQALALTDELPMSYPSMNMDEQMKHYNVYVPLNPFDPWFPMLFSGG